MDVRYGVASHWCMFVNIALISLALDGRPDGEIRGSGDAI